MANLPSDFQSRSDFYSVAATVFPSIFVHETRDAHSVVRIRVNETGEARGKESISRKIVREFLLKWDSG